MFRQKVLKERMKAANHRMDDLNCEKGKRSIFAFFFYSMIHELPQFWHRQIFSLVITVFSPPLDFFQTRFDIPSVQAAVKPLARLFMCPPKLLPYFLVLADDCWIEMVTWLLPHFVQNIFVPFSFPKLDIFYAFVQRKAISNTNHRRFALLNGQKPAALTKLIGAGESAEVVS